MKLRKKLLTIALTAALTIGATVTAFAATTKDDVISALKAAGATADQVTAATNYLNSSSADLTKLDDVKAQIDTVSAVLKNAGVTDVTKLSSADKATVIAAVQAAATDVKANVAVSTDSTTGKRDLTVKDASGNTLVTITGAQAASTNPAAGATATAATTTTTASAGASLQHTATNYGNLMVVGAVLVLGAAGSFALLKRKSVSLN